MFNKKEQKGIFLFLIIALVFVLTSWMRTWNFDFGKSVSLRDDEIKTIKLIELKSDTKNSNSEYSSKSFSRKTYNENRVREINLSAFDPNTVTADQLIYMGINEKTADNWQKYLKKGGKFYKKEDVAKIYGITPNVFKMLSPYIILKEEEKKSFRRDSTKNFSQDKGGFYTNKEKEKFIVDLNTCTDMELMELNGIGEKLSARIIKYRDKLGGFVRIDQLKEVYGLPAETYELIKDQIVVDGKMINKIRINLAEPQNLYSFPYIPKREAYQIFNYRRQHGNFRSINDLRKIKSLDETFIQKIEPYLDFRE